MSVAECRSKVCCWADSNQRLVQGGEGKTSAAAAAEAGPKEVVPVIGTPEGGSGFPGLYLARIPSRSFAGALSLEPAVRRHLLQCSTLCR